MRRCVALIVTALAVLFSSAYLDAQEGVVTDELTHPIHFEDLTYPLAARLNHIQGVVVIEVKLDKDGKVSSASALSGAKSLVSECLQNSKKWIFQPTGTPKAIIVYSFRIDGLCNMPCASTFAFRPPNLASITIGEPVVDHISGR